MTNAVLSDPVSTTDSDSRKAISYGKVAPIVVVALAHLPLLWQLAGRLWAIEHYQFFPLILLGAAYLGYRRVKRMEQFGASRRWLRIMLALGAFTLLAMAALLDSPWLAVVAAMVSIWMLLYSLGGRDLLGRVWPAWLLLWLAVPMPLGLDEQLIQSLQRVATNWASGVLDLLGYRHLASGVVIELPERSFLVEEACSGIHSLFAALACTLFYLIISRRAWYRWLILLPAAVFWVVVANALRVTSVTVIGSTWDVPIAEGIGHQITGALVFVLALLMIVSTDRLLLFLLPKRRQNPMDSRRGRGSRRSGRSWLSRIGLRSKRRRKGDRARKKASSGGNEVVVQSETESSSAPKPKATSRRCKPGTRPARWEGITLLTLFGLLGAAQLAMAMVVPSKDVGPGSAFFKPALEDMPSESSQWHRTGFRSITRDADDPNGQFSHMWTYERNGMEAAVSLDGPFVGWHNLAGCLRGQGWNIREVEHGNYQRHGESIPGGYTEMNVEKGASQHALVMFAVFDGQHRPMEPSETYVRFRAVRRFPQVSELLKRIGGGQDERLARDDSPTYQIQLFFESHVDLSETQCDEARELFHDMRRYVTTQKTAWGETPE